MTSSSQAKQAEHPEIRYRQTASVGGPPEPPVQAASAAQVSAAPPPSHDTVDAAGTETAPQQQQEQQQEENVDISQRLRDEVICTLNWNHDIRRDPLIIVVIITLLFL